MPTLAPHPSPTAPVLSHFSLAGKTALITGASRGIGLAAATGLAEAGANVAITYTSTPPAEADALAASIAEMNPGIRAKAYKCDVTSGVTAIAAVLDQAAADLSSNGCIDIVVCNAGVAEHIPAAAYPEDKFRGIFDVNVMGAMWTAQAAAQRFQRQQQQEGQKWQGLGSVIFTASVSATLVNVPQPQCAYNASKAAVVHLAKSLAVEWVGFARVNCISPGFIDTDMLKVHPQEWREKWFEMIPARRLCKTDELKGAYVFLASDASSYMTGKWWSPPLRAAPCALCQKKVC
jgi:sorbose reductase